MKKILFPWVCLMAALALSGCGKSEPVPESPPPPQTVDVNVPKLQAAFASGGAALKAAGDRAILAIRSGNYTGALAELSRLQANPGLTEAQRQAIREVSEQLRKNIAVTQLPPPTK